MEGDTKTWLGDPIRWGKLEGVAGKDDPEKMEVPLRDVRAQAQLLHRTSGEGIFATGFEPQRHSVMVLGRPVQARCFCRTLVSNLGGQVPQWHIMHHECHAEPLASIIAYFCVTPLLQAVVLTHTGATAAETEPYLSSRLRPLTPVVLYGREAKAEPVCHPEECVYYAWRDRLKCKTRSDVDPCAPGFTHAMFLSDYAPLRWHVL